MNVLRFIFPSPMIRALAETPAAVAEPLLEGKVFLADVGPKGKPAGATDDILSFRSGIFHSSACDQYGYRTGAYTARKEGEAVVFEAQTSSDQDGRLLWRGMVRGAAIDGTLLHYRKGRDAPGEMWFKGRVKG